nr:MAG TPA: hypothetical protein [Caudoviricetes sp.]
MLLLKIVYLKLGVTLILCSQEKLPKLLPKIKLEIIFQIIV